MKYTVDDLFRAYEEELDMEDDWDDDRDCYTGYQFEEEEGCVFPGQCVVPHSHQKWECYTAADAEEWATEGAGV